jgi:predicted amidophosphoribosyltransferase
MKVAPRKRPDSRPEDAPHVCNVCGQAAEKTICDECSERLRIEALSRKKHEEQGDAWSHWE